MPIFSFFNTLTSKEEFTVIYLTFYLKIFFYNLNYKSLKQE